MNKPVIDLKKCTLCGMCIKVCPKNIIEIENKNISVNDNGCILCSQCQTACKYNAVIFDSSLLKEINFRSFLYRGKYVSPGTVDFRDLINLMRSRRSVRNYMERDLPEKLLLDLVEFAVTAPSGSNSQKWEFTVVNGRKRVLDFGKQIENFFRKVNRIVANPVTRYLSFFVMGRALIKYYRRHYRTVEMALSEARGGRDMLFHGAPSLIIIHSAMKGSLPLEDAQYAAYNITQLAHAMGLGTCFIGYASEVMNKSKDVKSYLGIDPSHRVNAVLTVGYPSVKYFNLALRKNYKVNYIGDKN